MEEGACERTEGCEEEVGDNGGIMDINDGNKIPCPACGKSIKVIKVPCKCSECGVKLVIEYRPILPREWFE